MANFPQNYKAQIEQQRNYIADIQNSGAVVTSIDEWASSIRSGRPKILAAGLYPITGSIEVDTGEIWRGSGPNTVIRASGALLNSSNPGSVFISKDYDYHVAENNGRTHTGVPMCVQIRDLTVDGGGDVNDKPWNWNVGDPDLCHGIKIWGGGNIIDNVFFYDIAGEACYMARGSKSRIGEIQRTDYSENKLGRVWAIKCFKGFRFGNADATAEEITAAYIRDVGITTSSATNVGYAHLYGMNTGVHITDSGRSYFGRLETENCYQYGLKNYSSHSRVGFWRAYENIGYDGYFDKAIRIRDADVEVDGNGIWINGAQCELYGRVQPQGGTGIRVTHGPFRLTLTVYSNGTLVDITDTTNARNGIIDIIAGSASSLVACTTGHASNTVTIKTTNGNVTNGLGL